MNDLIESDASVYLTPGDQMILDEVDRQLERSLIAGDVTPILRFAHSLQRNLRVQGLALAKLLWKLNKVWVQFQEAGIEDEFVDVVQAQLNIQPGTIYKYLRAWGNIFENPQIEEQVKERLVEKPMKTLLYLSAYASDEGVEWSRVLEADTHQEVVEIVREERGEQTSSNTRLILMLDVRDGTILVKDGEDATYPVGYVNVQSPENAVKKAIEAIVHRAHILEV